MEQTCGNCARFSMEDIDGYGWCLSLDEEFKCDGPGCSMWEPLAQPNTQE